MQSAYERIDSNLGEQTKEPTLVAAIEKLPRLENKLTDAQKQSIKENLASVYELNSLNKSTYPFWRNLITPGYLAFQFINVLETWALKTAFTQNNPDWNFNGLDIANGCFWFLQSSLMIGVMRNNHVYAQNAPEEFETIFKTKADSLKKQLKNELSLSSDDIDQVMRQITKPCVLQRSFNTASALAGVLTKMAASLVMIKTVFPGRWWSLPVGCLLGLMEGIDTVYTKVCAIGYSKTQAIACAHGEVPVFDVNDFVLGCFVKLADCDLFPIAMAKIGPIAWFGLKTMTSLALLELIDQENVSLKNGFVLVTGTSATLYSLVFSRNNIRKKMDNLLPTKRKSKGYNSNLDFLPNALRLILGALPVSGGAGYAVYHLTDNLGLALTVFSGITPVLMGLLYKFKKFSRGYAYCLEFDWVDDCYKLLESYKKLNVFGSVVGWSMIGLNAFSSYIMQQASDNPGVLQWLLTALAAHQSTIYTVALPLVFVSTTNTMTYCFKRKTIAALRFLPAQISMYASALIDFMVINFLDDDALMLDDLGPFLYFVLTISSCLAALLAGWKDWGAMGSGLDWGEEESIGTGERIGTGEHGFSTVKSSSVQSLGNGVDKENGDPFLVAMR